MKSLILLIFAVTSFSAMSKHPYCDKTVAAFDIGSGTTKIKVAKVNCDENGNFKSFAGESEGVAYEDERDVAYKDSLDSTGYLKKDIINQGKQAFRELLNFAKSKNADIFVGVATAAFREAHNGKSVVEGLKSIDPEIDFQLTVITPESEGSLVNRAAKYEAMKSNYFKAGKTNIVSWDIGGGSMQIVSPKGGFYIELGSVEARNILVSSITEWSYYKSFDPVAYFKKPTDFHNNKVQTLRKVPLALDRISKVEAGNTFRKIAASSSQDFRNSVKQKNTVVITGGGVFKYAIRQAIKASQANGDADGFKKIDSVSRTDLQRALRKMSKNDPSYVSYAGKYAHEQYSNTLMVYSFMKELGINRVHVRSINLADGILVGPEVIESF